MRIKGSESKKKIEEGSRDFGWVLDKLPFGVSVQTSERKILYENRAVKELVGSFLYRQCYNRWHYIEGRGNEPCPDCPATIGLEDNKTHKIFRKTVDDQGNDLFLEIQFIPAKIDEKENEYIEIIRNVTLLDKAKVLANTSVDEILESIQFSIVKFGQLGGEVIATNRLDFAKNENIEDIIAKITVYIFSGVFQGFEEQEGLFGPFPVLDKTEYLMEAYLFRIEDTEMNDPRFKGRQPCMILFFFPREYYFLFDNRTDIENYIKIKKNNWKILQNIDEAEFVSFSEELKQLLRELI